VTAELSGPYDVIIISVKAHDTALACAQATTRLKENGFAVSFQNGIENVETVFSSFGPERTLAASLFVALRVDPPGTVRHTAAGKIRFGALDQAARSHEKEFLSLFTHTGIDVKQAVDIRLVLWRKLLWNVAFNPLSALLESTCGRLVRNPESRDLMMKLLDEGARAARVDGVAISEEDKERVLTMTDGLEDYKTSMYQDLEKHRPLELDAILGPVIRKNAGGGRAAPYADVIMKALRFKYGGHYLYCPRVAADVLVINGDRVLLIERKNPPHGWAIPGGFVDYGESVEDAAVRELSEETGIRVSRDEIDLLGVYSDPARDPRGHVVSAVYTARTDQSPRAGDDARNAVYFPLSGLPRDLAFDHARVIDDARAKFGL